MRLSVLSVATIPPRAALENRNLRQFSGPTPLVHFSAQPNLTPEDILKWQQDARDLKAVFKGYVAEVEASRTRRILESLHASLYRYSKKALTWIDDYVYNPAYYFTAPTTGELWDLADAYEFAYRISGNRKLLIRAFQFRRLSDHMYPFPGKSLLFLWIAANAGLTAKEREQVEAFIHNRSPELPEK